MRPGLGTTERQGYATALAGLWSGLSGTLARLEAIAAAPEELLDDQALEALPRLQYALHHASELAFGLAPPAGAESAHAELADALADARDATGDVCEVLDANGPEAAATLVHEWRAALFRVRLARLRLASRPEHQVLAPEPPSAVPRGAAVSALLVLAGTIAFSGGAVAGLWSVWAAGLALVAGGFLAYRS